MTESDDVERILSRYRPSGPSEALRDRLLRDRRPDEPRAWMYLTWPASAAAVVVAMVLHMQASHTFDAIDRPAVEQAARNRAAAIDDMTELIGGGDRARRAAEQWYEAERMKAAATVLVLLDQETTWIK